MRLANAAVLAAVLSIAAPFLAAAQETRPPLPTVTLPPELDRVLRDYERAWAAGDEAAVANLFTGDGFVLQNQELPIRGRAAIRQAYAPYDGPLRLRAMGFAAGDSVGYIVGGYRYGDAAEDAGKFVLALRRTRGGPWMIAADMDNFNTRPRRPAPANPPTAPPSPR
ncbi:MAG: YybH family protein [Longimicrobiaceae bacterium]